MRLIDADALMKDYGMHQGSCSKCPLDKYECKQHYWLKQDVCWMLDSAPTIEAEPVRRGRWIDHGGFVTCSVCNEEQYGIDTGRFYCPNCGARMT